MANEAGRPTIFLSYAHADREKAQRLTAALQKSGFVVWWDALIEGGTRYARSIDEALQSADVVVVLWSAQSIESDWVRDEAAQGRDRHRLVPLSLDGTHPPLGFRQVQMIDISGWNGRSNSLQLEAVRRAITAAMGQQVPPRLSEAPKIGVSRRTALAIGVGSVGVASGGGLIAWETGLIGGRRAQARSIAVLPFKNLSGDQAQAYLSAGLTDEVRSALTRNAGLMVLAATSSNEASGMAGDARSIADKLDVAYLLEGSVQRSGNIIRVAANLTNGRTGFSEWSQEADRQLEDVFAFESEIARIVSNALSVKMATDAPAPGGTRNVRAYEAYLQGKALYNLAKDEETDRQAKADYEIATAADPNFALAHAGLSRVLASIAASEASASELKGLYAGAIAEARRATELAPTLAEGHLALGYALFTGRLDIRGARSSYDAAFRYGSGNADIVLLYALYTVRTRRFAEAKAAIERAVALDPLNPRAFRAAGTIAYASRDYDGAIGHLRRALELNPSMSNANFALGNCLIEKGRLNEARTALMAEKSKMFRLTALAVLEHRAGNGKAAQSAYDALVNDVGDAALYQQAEVMAQWGRPDQAMALLYKARAVGDSGLIAITSDPMLDPIARDPRFTRFVRDIGFA
jgi:TolB-like protein/Tfp pilus assembly protein PilF